ncbi:hypothetical protein TNCT_711961 [Trichonephila clavata]|uniref:Uncharacterized protein n=1 Tax=Trichonephila clavata TaxID=2740835 RepID=A0A8X6FUH1_TRICU|nr:hypothetical protein TNCT_711961 [Trichonephila clavata]
MLTEDNKWKRVEATNGFLQAYETYGQDRFPMKPKAPLSLRVRLRFPTQHWRRKNNPVIENIQGRQSCESSNKH